MPFNIELTRNEPFVKLQIYKNTITLYFYSTNKENTAHGLQAWGHLEQHFLSSIPEYNPHWFRGPDSSHLKKQHTHSEEVNTTHFHREFNTEITPQLLALYLKHVWMQQNDPDHAHPIFKFFKNGEIDDILNNFVSYYKEYKGSPVETLVEEKSKLTKEEEFSYRQALIKSKEQEALANFSMFVQARALLFPTPTPPTENKFTIK